jgi:hypothetical protein
MIVDLLRKGKDEKLMQNFPRGPERSGPTDVKYEDAPVEAVGAMSMTTPGYIAYRREALSMGEPVMSPEEFKAAQSGNR